MAALDGLGALLIWAASSWSLEHPRVDVAPWSVAVPRADSTASDARVSELVEEADQSMEMGDYLHAINALNDAIERLEISDTKDPALELALVYRLGEVHANAYMIIGDYAHYAQAIEILSLYISLCPEAMAAERRAARAMLEDVRAASQQRFAHLRLPQALVEDAERRYDDGDYLGAIVSYRAALEKLPPESDMQRASLLGAIGAAHVKQYQVHGDLESLDVAEQTYRECRSLVTLPALAERVDTKLEAVARMKATEARWQREFELSKLRRILGRQRFALGAGESRRTLSLIEAFDHVGGGHYGQRVRKANRVMIGGLTTTALAIAGVAALGVAHARYEQYELDQFAILTVHTIGVGLVGLGLTAWAGVERHRVLSFIEPLIEKHNLEMRIELRIKRARQAYEGWSFAPARGVGLLVQARF